MLRKEAVSGALFQILSRLMDRDELGNHRLVGGTALALQIGHRISIDIDLFSDIPSDYTAIEMALFSEFGSEAQILHYIHSPLGKGISLSVADVKVDILDWSSSFQFSAQNIEGIRMADPKEIAVMKLDILTGPPEWTRFEKKDFVDLLFLLEKIGLMELIGHFQKHKPGFAFPERMVLEALQSAELADKKPHPKMLIPMDWSATKTQINTAIQRFMDEKFKKQENGNF
jgi:hypothetical protein